jgi:5'-3' exonuclease
MKILIDVSSISHAIGSMVYFSEIKKRENELQGITDKEKKKELETKIILDAIDNGCIEKDILIGLKRKINKILKDNNEKIENCYLFYDNKTNWRKELFQEYKGNRIKDRKKEVITNSIELFHNITNEINIKSIMYPTLEADDGIKKAVDELKQNFPNEEILVCSSDKDLLQLSFKYDNISYLKTGNKISKPTKDEAFFEVISKVLGGDPSDNLENTKSGVGKKTIENLYQQKSLEYDNLNDIIKYVLQDIVKSKIENKIKTNQDNIINFFNDNIEKNFPIKQEDILKIKDNVIFETLNSKEIEEIEKILSIIDKVIFNNFMINFENIPKDILNQKPVEINRIDNIIIENFNKSTFIKEKLKNDFIELQELIKNINIREILQLLKNNKNIKYDIEKTIKSLELFKEHPLDIFDKIDNNNELLQKFIQLKTFININILKDEKTIKFFSKEIPLNERIDKIINGGFSTSGKIQKGLIEKMFISEQRKTKQDLTKILDLFKYKRDINEFKKIENRWIESITNISKEEKKGIDSPTR